MNKKNRPYKIELKIKDHISPKVVDYEKEEIKETLKKPNKIVIKDKETSIYFNYPLDNPVSFSYGNDKGFTNMDLFQCVYEGYKKIYDEEEVEMEKEVETIEGLYNRKATHGKYGIWGHYITDLYIEGMTYDPELKQIKLIIGS